MMINKIEIEWHDCAHKLPDDDLTVLVCTSHNSFPVWVGFHSGEHWYLNHGLELDEATVAHGVTHWSELPDPPEGQ